MEITKKVTRCDAVVAQMILTVYDEHGHPVDEQVLRQVKLFRASAPDFWAECDKVVKALVGDV